jgi:hypothetical protein
MYGSSHTRFVNVDGYTITAISLCNSQITVKLEALLEKISLICTNAAICYATIDYVSILRLSLEDRRIDRVYTLLLDQETFLLLVLSSTLSICLGTITREY